MDVLLFICVLALIIIVIVNNSILKSKIRILFDELEDIKSLLRKAEKPIVQPKKEEAPVQRREEPIPTKVNTPESVTEFVPPKPPQEKPQSVMAQLDALSKAQHKPASTFQPTPTFQPAPKPKVQIDLEKFIGENLISKIGIIILVLGIGYFVKYAIDQEWINEYGRVAIGILVGGALISLAHRMRTAYKTFSSLLTGGGFAVLYLSITIAFHQYHLFSQTVAFALLVLVTIFSVILSLVYDKKELAIFSQLGGYAAPFMISTGEGNYMVLFSYLLILNAGLIALAYFKRWHILNILAYIATVLIFSGWMVNTFYFNSNPPYIGALVFASVFYLVFFLVNILNNLREKKPFNGIEISMILSNNLFYFVAGLAILNSYHEGMFRGAFTMVVAVYNFGWMLFLYRKQQIDKNLIYLMVGLVMSYVSLAIPIQLNGHSITLFWTAEFVILLWLSNMSGIRLLKVGHLIILFLVVVSLIADWSKFYSDYPTPLPIIFNQIFITGLVAVAGFGLTLYLLKKETETFFIHDFIDVKNYKAILSILIFVFSYLVFFLELKYQMNQYYASLAFRHSVYGIFNFAYLLAVLLVIRQIRWTKTFLWFYHVSLVALLVYLVYYNTMVLQMRDSLFFGKDVSLANFLFHYLVFPFMIAILIILTKERTRLLARQKLWSQAVLWFITFFVVYIASAELSNATLLTLAATPTDTYRILEITHKVGYPVLWGLSAFLLVLWGIRFKNKDFRIISLSLFSLIILKLFLFDVWKMNEGGRIASFIFLGVILLVVSFLYQKLKSFITDDEKPNEPIDK